MPDADGVTTHPIPYTYMEVYEHLVKEEKGHIWTTKEDRVKSEQMRAFLMDKFGTSSIAHVDDKELKNILEGPPLMMRTVYRK